ncbi:tetratricopeptide repeat domain protein [Penicillium capsulatum]|nr:tetratricopeptide repeat domain protein [Penicillium capsulatum]
MSGTGQVASIWHRAIQQYETITKKKLDDPSWKEVTTVDSMLQLVDRENASFMSFRSKGERILTVLKYAMTPVELVGEMAASGAAMAFPPSSLIFAGVSYLIKAANGVSDKYDAIIEIMLSTKLAEVFATLLEILAFARQEIKHGRLLSYGKNLLQGNDGAKASVAKLEKLFHSETALVGAETLSQVKDANVTLDQVQDDVTEIKNMLYSEPRKAQLINTVQSILVPSNYAEDRFSTINRNRIPNTGNWICGERGFEEWERGEMPILWICGTPGAGKSYIASNIISHLREEFPQQVRHPSGVSVGYFFYKDDDSETRSLSQSLRDVAFQIALNDPIYARHVASNKNSLSSSSTLSTLWRILFVNYFVEKDEMNSRAYVVLDALDEAFLEDRLEFFDLAQDIQPNGRLQLLMLGRPHIGDEMINLIELLRVPTVYVSDANNFQDIVHYIQASIRKSPRLRQLSKKLQSEIVTELSNGAQGMFIWVGFMLQELQRVRDHSGIRKALNAAPRGLSRMIEHVLRGFSELLNETPEYADDLNELLAWIVCAPQPLLLSEVEHILKWKNPDGAGWIRLEGDLRGQFASFFVLTREDRMTTADLSHLSADIGSNQNDTFDPHLDVNEDYDGSLDFGSDPRTTDVTFNHASLGDFFRDDKNGPVSAGEGFPSVGVNYHDAQAIVLLRLFGAIATSDSSKAASADALRRIACRLFTNTLERLDPKKITDEKRQTIGLSLAQLLSDESKFPRLVDPLTFNFFEKQMVQTFMKWLSDPVVYGSLPLTEKRWYEEAIATKPSGILERISRYQATKWLSKQKLGTGGFSFTCVRNFLDLEKGVEEPVSVERILEAAEWAGLEKTETWHYNIGDALQTFDFYDRALEFHQKALELDPDLWLARWKMANIYQKMGDFHRAIDTAKPIIAQLEATVELEDRRKHLHEICEYLGFLHWTIYESKECNILWEKAYQFDGSCVSCISARLEGFKENEDIEGGLVFWKELDRPLPGKTETRLTQFLWRHSAIYHMFTHGVIPTIQHVGNAHFFTKAYATAAAAARRENKAETAALLEHSLGYLYSSHSDEPEKAIAVWEHLLGIYDGKVLKARFMDVLRTVSEELGVLYLTQCVQVTTSDEERRRYGTLLQRLARNEPPRPRGSHHVPPLQDESPYVTESSAGFNLGHFYTICGNTEAARQCYKAQIANCIRLLSDDDDTNDQPAFYRLGRALGVMGDNPNAVAAFYQFEALIQREEDGPRSVGYWNCDECGIDRHIDCLTICCFCRDSGFCESCGPLVESGKQSNRTCGPKHKLLFIPPRTDAVKNRSQGHRSMLYVDGDWMTLDDFKTQLTKKYEL